MPTGKTHIVTGFAFLALINIAVALVLLRSPASRGARWISGLALLGLFMPLGILAEVLFAAPPVLVMFGGLSMVAAMTGAAASIWQTEAVQ